MTLVRILQGVSGLDFSWAPGEQVDMSDDDAAKWADGERAELVEPPAPAPAVEAPAEEVEVSEQKPAEERTDARPATEKAARTSRGGGRAAKPETR